MLSSAWPWMVGAGVALAGSAFTFWLARRQASQRPQAALLPPVIALLVTALGLGLRAWNARAWPGASPADALALLAGGGLIISAWSILSSHPRYRPVALYTVSGVTLIAAAALLGTAAALAPAWPATPPAPAARTWLFGLRQILAGIGLGGWLPALAASALWYGQSLVRSIPAQPAEAPAADTGAQAVPPPPLFPETVSPAEDPGRSMALYSFPWLTAACLASGAWNMVAHAAIGRAAPADSWLLAAWLLGGAYLLLTSSWRPLRLPGWFSSLIAAGVLAAGVMAAATAGSLR